MDADAGVKIIFVSVIGLIFVLTDLLVSGLDRPAWGIVPPAAAFVVPAIGLGIDTGMVPFPAWRSATWASWSPTG